MDLTEEWLSRCPAYLPEHERKLLRVRDSLGARSAEPSTVCGRAAAGVLRDGCADAETCRVRVQRWAAECGESDGTPLVVGLLERAVRRVDPEFEVGSLDLRQCDELLAGLEDAAKCVHRHRCAEALPRVDAYRRRCVAADGFPTLRAAVLMLRVVAGAEQDVAPFGVQAGSLDQTDDALTLESGQGAALRVCDERVDNLDEYLAARAACEGGDIRFARAVAATPSDGAPASASVREIRQGVFDSPDDETFLARFPGYRLVGELNARDRRAQPAFEEELAEVEAHGARPDGRVEAVRRFVTLLSKHSHAVQRRTLASLLSAHDAALVPVLEEMARIKVSAAGSKTLSPADRLGLARRAVSHPLADFRWDGVLEVGAPSPAARLQPKGVLPKAMAAYDAIATDLAARTRGLTIKPEDVEQGVQTARVRARACGAAEVRRRELSATLEACALGITDCDAPRRAALALELDQSHVERARAQHDLFVLQTSTAYDHRDELDALAREVDCTSQDPNR